MLVAVLPNPAQILFDWAHLLFTMGYLRTFHYALLTVLPNAAEILVDRAHLLLTIPFSLFFPINTSSDSSPALAVSMGHHVEVITGLSPTWVDG